MARRKRTARRRKKGGGRRPATVRVWRIARWEALYHVHTPAGSDAARYAGLYGMRYLRLWHDSSPQGEFVQRQFAAIRRAGGYDLVGIAVTLLVHRGRDRAARGAFLDHLGRPASPEQIAEDVGLTVPQLRRALRLLSGRDVAFLERAVWRAGERPNGPQTPAGDGDGPSRGAGGGGHEDSAAGGDESPREAGDGDGQGQAQGSRAPPGEKGSRPAAGPVGESGGDVGAGAGSEEPEQEQEQEPASGGLAEEVTEESGGNGHSARGNEQQERPGRGEEPPGQDETQDPPADDEQSQPRVGVVRPTIADAGPGTNPARGQAPGRSVSQGEERGMKGGELAPRGRGMAPAVVYDPQAFASALYVQLYPDGRGEERDRRRAGDNGEGLTLRRFAAREKGSIASMWESVLTLGLEDGRLGQVYERAMREVGRIAREGAKRTRSARWNWWLTEWMESAKGPGRQAWRRAREAVKCGQDG